MSGKTRDKVVTSGRLTGKVKVSRAPPDRGPPPQPQPNYSLYSTDSEDQVTTLHRGLDKCAALLSGILMADEAASAGLQRTPKKVMSKPRSSSFQRKKPGKKFPAKAEPSLQQEVISAQSSLQQLQDDLTELRKALQDTQSRLRDTEAEKALIKTELEVARNLLLESEREKIELASVAQLRLKEIKLLRRLLQSHYSSKPMDVQNSLCLTKQYFGQQNQVVASTDRIKEYLISLNQGEPPHTESLHVAAEREENSKGDGTNQREQCIETLPRHQDHHHHPNLSVSEDVPPCEVESVWSNWSMKSESTFNTRDEAAFRDGLAALDASIANLQKTIQLDLKK
ncbi:uncharacterized protein LOC106935415 isoform X5 [Poecilia latipinna]|uniref:uncharacterized protein LOC106935415 isoform X5 n=1 Tax=Poecilia latipinna TaxID=48699 RepID=UPI00072EACC8|nr:PREDICTED: coiled-coil domain-containing protein 14 isoform X5 [Poecilia latipinna]XP_016521528.1 PREDICTED: uncharacterized protein LOC103130589 isoform X5 [Poecilia formosa]